MAKERVKPQAPAGRKEGVKPEKRLAELRKQIKSENAKRGKHRRRPRGARKPLTWQSLAIGAARVLAILAFPFLLYVRSSVFFYAQTGMPWLAIAGGITLTLIVVALYATWLVHGIFGKKDLARIA